MRDEASEAAHAAPLTPNFTRTGTGSSSNKELRALWRRRDEAEAKLQQRVKAAKEKPANNS